MRDDRECERIHKIWRALNLSPGRSILNGSGVLALHGIERGRPMGDLDVFTTTEDWFYLLRGDSRVTYIDDFSRNRHTVRWGVFTTKGADQRRMCDPPYLYADMFGLPVNIFYDWRQRPDEQHMGEIHVPSYIKAAQVVDGIPCTPLGFLISWKLSTGRDKDLTDVLAIRNHLQLKERSEA
jgi:hypothetical protein